MIKRIILSKCCYFGLNSPLSLFSCLMRIFLLVKTKFKTKILILLSIGVAQRLLTYPLLKRGGRQVAGYTLVVPRFFPVVCLLKFGEFWPRNMFVCFINQKLSKKINNRKFFPSHISPSILKKVIM